ncbi:hypothetical protein LCGC14_3019500 [marine sediment metagenome]|uniref:Uncharacterized protein n=1 Tax=marine sediment metagenome TaxID=412755 RepID=A0A0F8Z3D2_9ZZZZ
MIVWKLFLVLVTGSQYSLLSIGDHFYATEIECNAVGRGVVESYPKGQMQWFCEPRSPKIPQDDSKPL